MESNDDWLNFADKHCCGKSFNGLVTVQKRPIKKIWFYGWLFNFAVMVLTRGFLPSVFLFNS